MPSMNKKLQQAIERVQTWPEERQEEAADVLLDMEAQSSSPYRLTGEQVAEVERRLADPNPMFLTLAELRARLARFGT
jgi:hypothetical protein